MSPRTRALAADAIFRIASMTKPITSLAAMMLVEAGQLRLDDPVSKYLPEFASVRVLTTFNDADGTFESRPPARPIAIRHLLTNTSGIAYAFVDARLAKIDSGKRTQADVPLLHDPGDRFTYGPSTAVLGHVIEKITGRPLDEFFKTRIFDPLGMVDTSVHGAGGQTRTRGHPAHAKRWRVYRAAEPAKHRVDGRRRRRPALDGCRLRPVHAAVPQRRPRRRGAAGHRLTIRQMLSNEIGRVVVTEQPSAEPTLARPFPFGGGKDKFGFGFQIEVASANRADSGLRAPAVVADGHRASKVIADLAVRGQDTHLLRPGPVVAREDVNGASTASSLYAPTPRVSPLPFKPTE